jgi:hypothetical protein
LTLPAGVWGYQLGQIYFRRPLVVEVSFLISDFSLEGPASVDYDAGVADLIPPTSDVQSPLSRIVGRSWTVRLPVLASIMVLALAIWMEIRAGLAPSALTLLLALTMLLGACSNLAAVAQDEAGILLVDWTFYGLPVRLRRIYMAQIAVLAGAAMGLLGILQLSLR